MAEDTSSQGSDKLKNQAEMMNLALESVLSEDQAREVLNGRLEDAFLLKAKVDVENRSGAILVLFSIHRKKILELYSLFGNSPILRKIRTFEDYQQFSLDFIEVQNSGGLDSSLSDMIGQSIHSDFDTKTIESFLPAWEKKDVTNTTLTLEQSLMKHLRANRVKVVAEVDQISSIKFRHKNPMQGIVAPILPVLPDEEEEVVKSDEDLLPFERQINDLTKQYSKTILCETMLSPMNGVEFDDLIDGQEILFKIPYSSPGEKAQAQALGCVDTQGKLLPLKAKFISIIKGEGEYHIFAKGPSNTVIHSIEENPVRVATTRKKTTPSLENDFTQNPSNMGVFVIAGIAVILILIMMLLLF
ncbi:MAG: hypothetical protein JJT78_06540 [Leptospira sp.]|nr:hypothetical protein [Leptospira sp.]